MRRSEISALSKLKRRIFFTLGARLFLGGAAVVIAIFSTLALIARISAYVVPLDFLCPLLLLCLLYALIKARRQAPKSPALMALLDNHNRLGGLLVAENDGVETNAWDGATGEVGQPQVYWNPVRHCLALAACLLFLILVYCLPLRPDTLFGAAPGFNALKDNLEEQIVALEETGTIDKEKADELQEKLEELEEDFQAKDPELLLESIDQLAQTMEEMALAKAMEHQQSLQQLGAMEAMAKEMAAIAENSNMADNKMWQQEAGALLEQLAIQQAGGEQVLSQICENGKSLQLDKETMEKLQNLLNEAAGKKMQDACKMAQAGLLSKESLESLKQACSQGQRALEDWLDQHPEVKAELEKMCTGAGRGGVDRGPGYADLLFENQSDETGVLYRDSPLFSGGGGDFEKTEKIGEQRGIPEVQADAPGSQGGVLQSEVKSGGANSRIILPHHRAAVQRYFNRPGREQPKKSD